MATSIYPNNIDGFDQLPLIVDGLTRVNANSINPLRQAILNIEKELGTTPSGSYESVRRRLDAIENTIGENLEYKLQNLENEINGLENDIAGINLTLGANYKGSFSNLAERLENIENLLISPLKLNTEDEVFEGSLLRITINGGVKLATANISGGDFIRRSRVIGSSNEAANINDLIVINATYGSLIKVRFMDGDEPNQSNNGYPVYLSTNQGFATMNAPTSAGSAIFQIGILQGADGVSPTPMVLFQPMLVAINS